MNQGLDEFCPQALENGLRTEKLGRNAVLLAQVDSTNAEARRRALAGEGDGTVVIASLQSAGRGRRGRHWVSEEGCGLWLTAVTQPNVSTEELQQVTLLTAVAVCRALRALTDGKLRLTIKWPNDVLTQGRKLCGILCETVTDGAGNRSTLIGVGINTRSPRMGYGDAEDIAISVQRACGREVPRLALAAALLNEMETLLSEWEMNGFAPVAAAYREFMVPKGTDVVLIDALNGKRGRIEGVDDGGALLVRLEDGAQERVISGEISVRGVGGYV